MEVGVRLPPKERILIIIILVMCRLALELCNCVYLYGFVRNWFGYMTYHYHDDYTPRTTQAKRDSTEFPLIKSLLKEYTGRLVYVHPCVTGDQLNDIDDDKG